VVRVRAQLINFRFFNGMRQLTIKVYKVISADVKEFSQVFVEKMRKQEKNIRSFIVDLKRHHLDAQQRKDMKREEEQ
jgi:hypothetical protein